MSRKTTLALTASLLVAALGGSAASAHVRHDHGRADAYAGNNDNGPQPHVRQTIKVFGQEVDVP